MLSAPYNLHKYTEEQDKNKENSYYYSQLFLVLFGR